MKTQRRERRKAAAFTDRLLPAAQSGIFIALCLLLILAIHLIHEDLYPDLDLISSGISPVFTGYNGYGTIESWHPENNALSFLTAQQEKEKNSEAAQELASSISCQFDQNSDLENGETVTYSCSYDKDAAKRAGVTVRNSSRTYTVVSLRQIQTIDPFAGLYAIYGEDGTFSLHTDGPVSSLPVEWNYEWIDDSHLRIQILYDEDEISRRGYRFRRSSITLETDRPLFLDHSSLRHLSKANRLEINKDIWDQPVIRPDISSQLQAGETLLEEPQLIRWDLDEDGMLEIVLQIHVLRADGTSAGRQITVRVPSQAFLHPGNAWSLDSDGISSFSSNDISWSTVHNSK